MKYLKLLLVVFVVSGLAFSQQRALLGPGDAIPVEKGQSALQLAKKMANKGLGPEAVLVNCPPVVRQKVGKYQGTINTNFGFFYGDVAAMVYQAPFTGVIESVYFESFGAVSNPDSSANLRIMHANTRGFATAATHMGYWPDTTSGDTIPRTAYQDEATGPFACSSISGLCYPPVGTPELWGLGGFPVTWHHGITITGVAMLDLGYEPTVTAGDSFGVCIQVPRLPETGTNRQEMSSDNAVVTPFRFHKYYNHNRNVAGSAGWWAREFDMFIWVVMRANGDLPPTIVTVTPLHHTTSQAGRTVQATGFDCNAGNPADTGIASMTLHYKVGAGAFNSVPMTVASFVWSGDIPAGLALDSTITYYVSATDIHGNPSNFNNQNYRIVRFSRDNYTTTFPAYSFVDITTSGTQIPSTAFFPAISGTDDGTAGPFSIGGNFTFFGQTLTTAWVGANGALGLTATAAETVNVNAGNFFANWDIPQSGIAKNFVSPFWNDLYLGPGGHGAAYYQVSGNQFIVEWYRVGNFNTATDTLTTFELILDRTSPNSVLFQYANVGNTGLDSSNLTGIQGGGGPGPPPIPPTGWVFLNRFGYPTQSRPAANFAVKMTSTPVGVTGKDKEVPAKFALHANYPNPFNPSTSVSYDIATRSLVELTVYNLLGEKIADLVNGEQGPGSYSTTWDGRNQRGETVASGIYIYRLKAGDFLQTRKMLLLK